MDMVVNVRSAQASAADAVAVAVAGEIVDGCSSHPALSALQLFNTHFADRALARSELLLFLASMAAFNRHTIGGIAILAGRLSDEVLPHSPESAHEIGAHVLDAAVDEYGLRESQTHLALARNFAGYLGFTWDEVEARENSCGIALALGDALFGWYREVPTAFALGVHTASEVTSVNEFFPWHDVFLKFPQYRLSLQTPEFEYMRAHCAHEPDHTNGARLCIAQYLDVLPGNGALLREGAENYLNLYQKMFRELDTLIFK